MIKENAGEQIASVMTPKCGIYHDQNNMCKSVLWKISSRDQTQSNEGQDKTEGVCVLATRKHIKCHKVHFQDLQQEQLPRNMETKCQYKYE